MTPGRSERRGRVRGAGSVLATLVVLPGLLVTAGCGSPAPPTDAPMLDFCLAYGSVTGAVDALLAGRNPPIAGPDAFARLREVGTPAAMSADERHGFDLFLHLMDGIDPDWSFDQLRSYVEQVPQEDLFTMVGFFAFGAQHCG